MAEKLGFGMFRGLRISQICLANLGMKSLPCSTHLWTNGIPQEQLICIQCFLERRHSAAAFHHGMLRR